MMIESADVQIGRALADLGLATLAPNGRTLTSLNLGNTLLVILGDNGSQGAAARAPFNLQRAKGTVYQTGIWVPMIVAGPMVVKPGRAVDDMVNTVDLYQLFGSVGGVNVDTLVPPSHVIDSKPMLPYLINPNSQPIRHTNFSQLGPGTFSPLPENRSWPCQIGNLCNDTLVNSQSLCENDNGGTWYGPGTTQKSGVLGSCCLVKQYWADHGNSNVTLAPIYQYAVRGKPTKSNNQFQFKLVELQGLDCSKPITNASQKAFPWATYQLAAPTQELYDLSLNKNGLDNTTNQLCASGKGLHPNRQGRFGVAEQGAYEDQELRQRAEELSRQRRRQYGPAREPHRHRKLEGVQRQGTERLRHQSRRPDRREGSRHHPGQSRHGLHEPCVSAPISIATASSIRTI